MTTLDDAKAALIAADKAGNVEDAQRLADFIRSQQRPGSNRGGFFKEGVARGLGAPVELANSALSLVGLESNYPALGRKMWSDLFGLYGSPMPPEGTPPSDYGEAAARGAAEGIAALVPFGAGATALSRATRAAPSIANYARTFLPTTGAGLASTTGLNIGAGGLAGAGGQAAADVSGNERARAFGEITGGAVPAMAPDAFIGAAKWADWLASKVPLGLGAIYRGVKSNILPFTESGARVRAERRIQDLVPDPAAAVAAIDEPTIANLTIAQRTGEPGLLALQRAVEDQNLKLRSRFGQQTEESVQTLKDETASIGGMGSPEATKTFLRQRRDALLGRLESISAAARATAAQRLARLRPDIRTSEAGRVVAEEVEGALRPAKFIERRAWADVPMKLKVSTDQAKARFSELWDETPIAQRDDIPAIAKQLLGRSEPESTFTEGQAVSLNLVDFGASPHPVQKSTGFKDEEPVKELQGLRSKLLEESRIARAAGNRNKARIADELADGLLEDLGVKAESEPGPVGESLRTALAVSRKLAETFYRGAPARILGTERTGGPRIAPELATETTIGGGGPRGAVAAKEIARAAPSKAAAEGMRQHMLNRFEAAAIKDGILSRPAAQEFIRKNADLLDQFPDLRAQISKAQSAAEVARISAGRTERATAWLSDQKKSYTARFLNANMDQEFEAIFTADDPGKAAFSIRRAAQRDTSGRAVDGLKASVVDYMMQNAGTTEGRLSGTSIQDMLSNKRMFAAVQNILNPDEIGRLRQIAAEFNKIKAGEGRTIGIGGILPDEASSLLKLVVSTVGAKEGARIGKGAGGASLVTAGFFAKRFRGILQWLTVDKAEVLLTNSVQDGELMKTLLMPTGTPSGMRAATRRLNAWLEIPGRSLFEDREDKK